MATQPCPCGYQGHAKIPCRCPPSHVQRYRSRISGPLLDRIDLRVELVAPSLDELAPRETRPTSLEPRGAELAERVVRARVRMRERQGSARNAELLADALDELAPLDAESRRLFARATGTRVLTARGTQAVRRVARTLADLADDERVDSRHIARALALRSPLV
ncbi:MAG: ATP-binding protein [Planctomycetes bacterium]|nr:ATP-binding protein [Planctomycetota bacterium]